MLRVSESQGTGGGGCARSAGCRPARRPGRACCCTGERSRAAACIAPSAVSGCANAYLSSAGALAPRPRAVASAGSVEAVLQRARHAWPARVAVQEVHCLARTAADLERRGALVCRRRLER